jgi:hypothetical protein
MIVISISQVSWSEPKVLFIAFYNSVSTQDEWVLTDLFCAGPVSVGRRANLVAPGNVTSTGPYFEVDEDSTEYHRIDLEVGTHLLVLCCCCLLTWKATCILHKAWKSRFICSCTDCNKCNKFVSIILNTARSRYLEYKFSLNVSIERNAGICKINTMKLVNCH